MVTTPNEPEASATTREDIADAVQRASDGIIRGARSLITGDERGRIRRNVLFVVVGVGLWLSPLAPVALAALLLLALTDNIVVDA